MVAITPTAPTTCSASSTQNQGPCRGPQDSSSAQLVEEGSVPHQPKGKKRKVSPLDYHTSVAAVTAAITEYAKHPNKHSLSAVPTELLAADSEILVKDASVDRVSRAIATRPCRMVLVVFFASFMCCVMLVLFGDIGFSVQMSLFTDQADVNVKRQTLLNHLAGSNGYIPWEGEIRRLSEEDINVKRRALRDILAGPTGYTPFGSGRRLSEVTNSSDTGPTSSPPPPLPPPTGVLLQYDSTAPSDSGPTDVHTIEIVYSSKVGSNVLSPAGLSHILIMEMQVREWAVESAACAGLAENCRCELLDSVVNYVFHNVALSQQDATPLATSFGVGAVPALRRDGFGLGSDAASVIASVRCGLTLSPEARRLSRTARVCVCAVCSRRLCRAGCVLRVFAHSTPIDKITMWFY